MIQLSDYIVKDRIFFASPQDKQQALRELVELSRETTGIDDFERFRTDVHSREEIVSTGIGQGVAIPHVKSANIQKFFITIGVFRNGVDWESIDAEPVFIAFLIGGPDDHQVYLQILAKLTLIIRNPELRKAIVSAVSPDDVVVLFKEL